MNVSNLNAILHREEIAANITRFLREFQLNKGNLTMKRGIYLYGNPGCGKTTFIKELLADMNYDILLYDAGDIRNKAVIETITKHNMTDTNVMSAFHAKKQPIAIVMDEIDGMNSGDKGGINTLIKLIRPKKTKKQKLEDTTNAPIICISNYHADKKIKEMMSVCDVHELPPVAHDDMTRLVAKVMPKLSSDHMRYIADHVHGDLRRLTLITRIYEKSNETICPDTLQTILFPKSFNEDTKQITCTLFNTPHSIHQHVNIMNETDRTIVGLLWHENVIDLFESSNKAEAMDLYIQLLDNICFADYIDRVTFQKQIWQFNELSSLIKTFHNSKLLHDAIDNKIVAPPARDTTAIRFTKVLTKYSTEYNNSTFIQNLCHRIGMDKNDMFVFFRSLDKGGKADKGVKADNADKADKGVKGVKADNGDKGGKGDKDGKADSNHNDDASLAVLLDNYDISRLDINRIMRYVDKQVTECTAEQCASQLASSGGNEKEYTDKQCVNIEEYGEYGE